MRGFSVALLLVHIETLIVPKLRLDSSVDKVAVVHDSLVFFLLLFSVACIVFWEGA